MRQGEQTKLSIGIEKGREQSFAVSGRPVIEVLPASAFIDQACIPEDPQVPADPGLLLLGDDASITDTELPGLGQKRQQSNPMRIAQRLALPTEPDGLDLLDQPGTQCACLWSIDGLQSELGVPHFGYQTNNCASVSAAQVRSRWDHMF